MSAKNDAVVPLGPTDPTPPSTWQHVETASDQAARKTVLVIALLLLAAACITAFYAALRIASIWFEARYVPIAQLVVSGLVIALCVAVVRRLKVPS